MNTNIAIIPARGGSKRLPRKNILPINDHPMISYPITAAINCGLFDDVVVSTEDEEVASIALRYGATVIERPDGIAQDKSTVVEVCNHILLKPQYESVKLFCCLYATAIFVTINDIKESGDLLNKNCETDYVMGVSKYNYHPVQALQKVDGYLKSMWTEYENQQSQFYPELLVSNGTLYWAKVSQFQKDHSFYGEHLKGYISSSTDIDTIEDYEAATLLAKELMLTLSPQC
jgi:pseudaminic acid cytidylyltransferase